MAGSHASAKAKPHQRSSGRPLAIQEEHSESTKSAKGKSKAKEKMSGKRADGAAMGAAMRLDRGRMAGPAVDPVEWIANVRMEKDDSAPETVATHAARTGRAHGRGILAAQQSIANGAKDEMATEEESDAEPGLTSQRLGAEIVAINRQLPRVVFEKVDVAKGFCVLTLYGPWADHEPAFLRITFHFPRAYPRQAPKLDLEKTASISLKTRAYLLKGLTRLSDRAALAGRPCIEICARFLIGEPIKSLDEGDGQQHSDEDAERSTSRAEGSIDSSSSESDDAAIAMRSFPDTVKAKTRLASRRMGAAFGPNNELVVFGGLSASVRSVVSSQQPSRSTSRSRTRSERVKNGARSRSTGRKSAFGEMHTLQQHPPKNGPEEVEEESRFLRSYTALSSAMTSLAQFSKSASEGLGGQTADHGVRDSDVVQLMSTDFFARRLLQKSDFFDDFGDQAEPRTGGTRNTNNRSHFYSGSGASTPGARRGDSDHARRPDEEDARANTLHHADLRGALPAPAAILALHNRLRDHRRRTHNTTVQIYQLELPMTGT